MNKLKFHFKKNDPTRFNIRKHLVLQGAIEVTNENDANFSDANSNWQWIYKPSTLNNGEAIKLFNHIDEIAQHNQILNRLGGDFVIQHYIDNPNLLNGHKYTLRLYVVLSNFKGYKLYPHGYYNIGRQKYPETFITNEHLTDPIPNVIQMPTSKVPEFHLLMPQINTIVDQTIQAFTQSTPTYFAPSKTKAFDILGFDFVLDETMNLWLLEINHGPWFPTTEPLNLQYYLFDDFWNFVTNEFVTCA